MKQDQFSRWDSTKVKARANYTCQKCGAMENIQAHDPTKAHTNWQVGIALCGDCHSKEHPDVPTELFSLHVNQSRWPNVSARFLAKEFDCHGATVLRWARKLGILPPLSASWQRRVQTQPLSPKDKECLRDVCDWRNKITHICEMDKKVIHYCKACGISFEVEQGSRQQYCIPCGYKRMVAGKAQGKEAK
ncbi:MAG: hypothetical protein KJ954_14275 [Alphaproteobacteria bacterium]|nr:hypothetical protein [Alphaproteobacteria bacterium]